MTQISRRKVLSTLGTVGAASLLTGCRDASLSSSAAAAGPSQPADGACPATPAHAAQITPSGPSSLTWDYVRLDPADVADRAYRIYPEGGCMYAVVASVVGALADRVGEPFRSFPVEMMRYGDGGVGAWGSLCGVVNGGAALIGMFRNEKTKKRREAIITELGVWYETTPLPEYRPISPKWADEAEPSVAGALLCHVSDSRLCKASAREAFSVEKNEGWRRLAADGASKIVQLLNRDLEGDLIEGKLTPAVNTCVDCHGTKNLENAMVKMNCATCHQFERKHP